MIEFIVIVKLQTKAVSIKFSNLRQSIERRMDIKNPDRPSASHQSLLNRSSEIIQVNMKFFIAFATLFAAAAAQMQYGYAAEAQYNLGAPAYGGSSYSAPAPSYSAPSYSAPAPSYSAPSYSAPSYTAKPSYSPSYAGPATSYTYPSPAPPVPCPTNLLFSCAPNVSIC